MNAGRFKSKFSFVVSLTMLIGGLLTGCGTAEEASKPAGVGDVKMPQEPLTMQMYQSGAGLSDTEFNDLIAGTVKKKFPNITLELVRQSKDVQLSDLVTAGNFPDLMFIDSLGLNDYLNLNLLTDMNSLIKKSNFDLNRFENRSIEEIKRFGDKGEVYAIPFSLNFGALFYNKDIFDKEGMSYPTDGMTWDDVVELANKLALKDPDIHTLSTDPLPRTAISLRLPYVNPKTENAALVSDDWNYLFKLYKTINDIPDNKNVSSGENGFLKDKNSAMMPAYGAVLGIMEDLNKAGQSFAWDLATFPLRKGAASQGMETESHVLAISATSKRPDVAFQIISYLSSSEEVQTLVASNGRISPLKDDKYKKVFGSNLKSLQGKNVASIFKNKFGPNAVPTRYDPLLKPILNDALTQVISGVDINTALREAEEKANQAIAAAKTK